MKIRSKIGVLTLLAGMGVENCLAETITLYGKLTTKSAYDINDTFVRNAGATENVNPEQADVILAQIADVLVEDVPVLEEALHKWMARYKVEDFKITIARAESSQKKLVLLGDYTLDEAYSIRQRIKCIVESAQTPSGQKYTTHLSRKGVFVPIIYVGTTDDRKPNKITWMVNRRLYNDDLIYPASHFQVEVESLHLESY